MSRKINWAEVTKNIQEQNTFKKGEDYSESNAWKVSLFQPKLKDDGTYQVVIRFVPRPENDGDGVPYVKEYRHSLNTENGFINEGCPFTHGDPCPICTEHKKAWKIGEAAGRESPFGKKTNYYANILIVKDPQNPENNGKVFIYRFGKKIYEKIMEKLMPPEGSIDEPVQVFDYVEGMNFNLKIKKIKTKINGRDIEYPNYDASSFTGKVEPINVLEDEVEKQLHNLGQIIDKKWFKSAEQLKERLDKVMNGTPMVRKDESSVAKETIIRATEKAVEKEDEVNVFSEGDDGDDDFFAKLKNGKN